MSSKASPAARSVLFFSQPPQESPSLVKTVAAVSGVHGFVLIVLIALTLVQRDHLPMDSAFAPPQLLENDFVSLSYAGIGERIESRAAAARRSARPARGRPHAPPVQTSESNLSLLGTPVVPHLAEPPVVPATIPPPAASTPVFVDPLAPPTPKPVQPVAPRGMESGSTNGERGASGIGNSGLSLDDLARGPVFTPFTQAPELMNRSEVRAFLQTRYPPALSARGLGGRAVLWLLIDPAGGIRKGILFRSSGNSRLDDAALEAIDRMEFRPAVNQGKRVPVWVQLPISFQPDW
jgi:periplasmic protein TonB